MKLVGKTCTLRPFCPGDEESLSHNADNRKIWRNMADLFPHPYTQDEARSWIEKCVAEPAPHRHFAITIDNEVIGGTGMQPQLDIHRVTARAGYWVGESYWGRGIATEAFTLFTAYVFENFCDVARVEATVFEWNPASCRVLEKCGYTHECLMRDCATKDGQVVGMHLYAKLR